MTVTLTPFSNLGNTVATTRQEYPEWHQGRTRYGLWALEIDSPEVLERFTRAQLALADYLLPQYQRQPHITLYVCGFLDWLAPQQPTANDNFSRQRLELQCSQLSERLRDVSSRGSGFHLQIGGIDSFSSAPYLQVIDPNGSITRLREVCHSSSALIDTHEFRTSAFKPHLTLGLYREAFACRPLAQRFERLNQQLGLKAQLPLTVKALHFMSYASHSVGSPLRTELSLAL